MHFIKILPRPSLQKNDWSVFEAELQASYRKDSLGKLTGADVLCIFATDILIAEARSVVMFRLWNNEGVLVTKSDKDRVADVLRRWFPQHRIEEY